MGSICLLGRRIIQQRMVRQFVEQRILAGQFLQQRLRMVCACVEQLQRSGHGSLLRAFS